MLYTLGEWNVKPGREDEFVSAWRETNSSSRPGFTFHSPSV